MNEFNNLSREQLLKIINHLTSEAEKKNKIITNQQAELEKQAIMLSAREERILQLEAEMRDINVQLQHYIEEYENKRQQLNKAIVEKFCSNNETLPKEAEAINEVEAINEAEQIVPKEKKKRKSSYDTITEDLKTMYNSIVIVDYDFENEVQKSKAKLFGKDETYKIEITPVSFEIVKFERLKYKDKDHIYQKTVDDVFPHSLLTASLAANIIEMKYNLGIPLYRYANYMNSLGLALSPQNLSDYVMRTMKLLEPLYNELEKALVSTKFKVLHGDETTLKVIEIEKEHCFMFVYTTSFWDHAVYIYKFSQTRKTDNTKELLKNYEGYFECDGYPGYDDLPNQKDSNIKIQRCWVHVRRHFFDCIKTLPKSKVKSSPAYNVVKKIDEMFAFEAKMREKKYTRVQIKEARNSEEYQQIIKELDKMILSIECGSNNYLRKAVNNYKNDKHELYTFLEDGYVDICNNLAERTVKPFVIARKNFLFCKTHNGAEVTGKMFSIVQTAKANGLKSELYMKYVIENINKTDISNLLPWSSSLPENLKIDI